MSCFNSKIRRFFLHDMEKGLTVRQACDSHLSLSFKLRPLNIIETTSDLRLEGS